MIQIDADFENGSLDRAIRLGENWYHLAIRPDTYYWFHCRLRGCMGREIIFELTCTDRDEGRDRWDCRGEIVRPVVSYDRRAWQPVEHSERAGGGRYRFRHTFTADEAYLCFGHPYTYSDLLAWLKTVEGLSTVTRGSIGASRCGLDMPLLTITRNPASRETVLMIAREDADEAAGSMAAEGAVRLLTDETDEQVRRFLERHIVQFVPMVTVDGVIAGAMHSAGYGYGGGRWHEEPAPVEIQNVKDAARRWAAEGSRFALAGKIHSGMTLQPLHRTDVLTADPRFHKVFFETFETVYADVWNPRHKDLEIRPRGYFERFMLDEFALAATFGTHAQGTTPENARRYGEGTMRAVMNYLED